MGKMSHDSKKKGGKWPVTKHTSRVVCHSSFELDAGEEKSSSAITLVPNVSTAFTWSEKAKRELSILWL